MEGKVGLIYPSGESEEFCIGAMMRGSVKNGKGPCNYYIALDDKKEQVIISLDAMLVNRWINEMS